MFAVITKRVIKFNIGQTDKFAPRTANQESYAVSGPWRTRKAAELAALKAMGVHTTLGAEVVSEEDLPAAIADAPYMFTKELKRMQKLMENASRPAGWASVGEVS